MNSKILEEWQELESDPGLFSLLLESLGVKGVEVIDVYDLDNFGDLDKHLYGFIFLHKWIDDKKRRKHNDNYDELSNSYLSNPDKINSLFFARQIISNSCATLALLSIVMNSDNLVIGPKLEELKSVSKNATPDDKGLCIANMTELAKLHNQFAKGNIIDKRDSDDIYTPLTNHIKNGRSVFVDEETNSSWATSFSVTSQETLNDKIESTKICVSSENTKNTDPQNNSQKSIKPLKKKPLLSKVETTADLFTTKHESPDSRRQSNNVSPAPSLSSRYSPSTHSSTTWDDDRFHFVSFIPYKGELLELDGLRPYPICHGNWDDDKNWTDTFKDVIKDRINKSLAQNMSERYNLLAVRKDVRYIYKKKIMTSKSNLLIFLDTFAKLFQDTNLHLLNPISTPSKDIEDLLQNLETRLPNRIKRKFLDNCNSIQITQTIKPGVKNYIDFGNKLSQEISDLSDKLNKENEKWDQYRIEHARRTHNYFPFINLFLQTLHKYNLIDDLIEANLTSPIAPKRLKKGSGGKAS